MSHPEYLKALRMGEKAFREARSKGKYPYLPALDEITQNYEIKTEVPLGVMEIPLDQIAGTVTAGRQTAFACNFMPLMKDGTEFSQKWANLYDYQLEEGVKDPIVCYEFMNKYYVLEGNKRVSVFKYLDAFGIEGNVTRLIPAMSDDPKIKVNYEYMEFFARSQVNYVQCTRPGSFPKLIKALGMEWDHNWTDREREDFSSSFLRFSKVFDAKGGKKLSCTTGDAFLMYLSVYPYSTLPDKTDTKIGNDLSKIWDELEVLNASTEETLVMQPAEEEADTRVFTRFLNLTGNKTLNIAFIHEKTVAESGWTYSHELGRMHLNDCFGDRVHTCAYFLDVDGKNKEGVLEAAIEDNNQIIFTTSERLLEASLKVAVRHPKVRILNCCVNKPYRSIRTYFGRMYEAKFLEGMIAGAMTENDRIAYAADYPIYGALANINAFALGAASTNPKAKVYLNWSSVEGSSIENMIRENDITTVADFDMIRPGTASRKYGLYQINNDEIVNLAAPIWNWGKFYEKIVRDILSGTWNTGEVKRRPALNYWWGISGGIIDLIMPKKLPVGLTNLTNIIKREIYNESFSPFYGKLRMQDGNYTGTAAKTMTAEEIITMDWLAENVIGSIPTAEELTEEARSLVQLQGIRALENGGKEKL